MKGNMKNRLHLVSVVVLGFVLVACNSTLTSVPDGVSGTWLGAAEGLPVQLELIESSHGRLTGKAFYDLGAGLIYAGALSGTVSQTPTGGASVNVVNPFKDGSGSAKFEGTLNGTFATRKSAKRISGTFSLYDNGNRALVSVTFSLQKS